MIDFWKSSPAHGMSPGGWPKSDRGTKCRVKERTREEPVNRITRWRKWMRPETQKQQTDANSRIKTSAAERVLKISEIYAKVTEF